jgi:hypothetical protein
MTTPATGEKTPKRKRNDAELALIEASPASNQAQELAIQAMFAAFPAITTGAAATATTSPASNGTPSTDSSPNPDDDVEFLYEIPEDTDRTVKKPPAIPQCSLQSLPTAFNTFAENISKKVQALLMQKKAKTKVAEKLRTKSFIPASLKTKFELTSSKEMREAAPIFSSLLRHLLPQ